MLPLFTFCAHPEEKGTGKTTSTPSSRRERRAGAAHSEGRGEEEEPAARRPPTHPRLAAGIRFVCFESGEGLCECGWDAGIRGRRRSLGREHGAALSGPHLRAAHPQPGRHSAARALTAHRGVRNQRRHGSSGEGTGTEGRRTGEGISGGGGSRGSSGRERRETKKSLNRCAANEKIVAEQQRAGCGGEKTKKEAGRVDGSEWDRSSGVEWSGQTSLPGSRLCSDCCLLLFVFFTPPWHRPCTTQRRCWPSTSFRPCAGRTGR